MAKTDLISNLGGLAVEKIQQISIKQPNAMVGKLNEPTIEQGFRPEENVLNKFATYTYIFTLSALSNTELDNPQQILSKAPHDIIARSGGIGEGTDFSNFNVDNTVRRGVDANSSFTLKTRGLRDALKTQLENSDTILRRGHDIFFDKVSIEGIYRPNEERKLMNFNQFELELVEPLGVTLFEKLRVAAFNNGFVDHIDAPFLLTLEFKGTDEKGKFIDVPNQRRYLPIKITNCEMKFQNGYTRYVAKGIAWTEFAMTDRFLYTRHQANIFNKVSNSVQSLVAGSPTIKKILGVGFDSLEEACTALAEELTNTQDIEIEKKLRQYEDIYKINVDPNLFVDAAGKFADNANFNIQGASSKYLAVVGPNMSIAKVLTDLVSQSFYFRNIHKVVEKYWKDKDAATSYDDNSVFPDPMVPWFKIVTNVKNYTEHFDLITRQHQKEITFTIVPYRVHILNFTIPGLSGGSHWFKTTKKAYNYIFTGENTEILNLDINYNYGFMQARLLETQASESDQTSIRDSQLSKVLSYYSSSNMPYPEPLLPGRGRVVVQKTESPTTIGAPTTTADEFFDYLTNPRADMVNVEMTIQGDPAWIGQDFALPKVTKLDFDFEGTIETVSSPNSRVGGWDEQKKCFNFDQAEPLASLTFRFPTDINEKKGIMDFQNLENVVFSGLYKVQKVTSNFQGGKFTQTLEMIRMNNQGNVIDAIKSAKQLENPNEATLDADLDDLLNGENNYGAGGA